MSPNPLQQLRLQASRKQNHRCYYCEFPMWHEDSAAFLRAYSWISARHVHHLKCTAEHLVACQDGGRTSADNIAAACSWCNSMRHRYRPDKAPEAAKYKKQVMRLVPLGRWHPVASRMYSSQKNGVSQRVCDAETVHFRLLVDRETAGRSSLAP